MTALMSSGEHKTESFKSVHSGSDLFEHSEGFKLKAADANANAQGISVVNLCAFFVFLPKGVSFSMALVALGYSSAGGAL